MAERMVIADFDALNQRYLQKLKQAESRHLSATQKMQASVARLQDAWLKYAVVLGGLTIVKNFISESIEMYGKQEQAVKKLDAALGRHSRGLVEYAAQLQNLTTFGDETIIEAEAMIAMFVKNEEQVKALTKATLDLAVANGMQLTDAAKLVAKSVGSTTNALSRYGVKIDGAVGSTERINSAIENLTKLFGGQAEAQAQTYTGRITQMENKLGDLQERIGEGILPTLSEFTDSVTRLGNRLDSSGVSGFIDKWLKLATIIPREITLPGVDALLKLLEGTPDLEDQIMSPHREKNKEYAKFIMQTYKQTSNILTNQSATVGEIKERLKELKIELDETVPGSERYLAITKEIEALEKKITTEKVKQNKEQKKIVESMLSRPDFVAIQAVGARKPLPQLGKLPVEGVPVPEFDPLQYDKDLQMAAENFNNKFAAAEDIAWNIQNIFNTSGSTLVDDFLRILNVVNSINSILTSLNILGGGDGGGGLFSFLGGLFGFLAGGPGGAAAAAGAFAKGGVIVNRGGSAFITDAPKFAAGTDSFIVPPGYSDDSFPILVRSGERVDVTPAGRVGMSDRMLKAISDQLKSLNMNIAISTLRRQKIDRIPLEGKLLSGDIYLSNKYGEKIKTRIT